jgi:hypothetical protein
MTLTIAEVAAECKVTPDHVHDWIRTKQLPAFDASRFANERASWRIERADLDAFKASRSNQPQVKQPRREKRVVVKQIV